MLNKTPKRRQRAAAHLLYAAFLLASSVIRTESAAAQSAAQEPVVTTIHLVNGTVLIGTITSESEASVGVHVEGIGDLTVDASAITSRTTGVEPVTHVATHEPTPDGPPVGTTDIVSGVKWTRTLSLGGNYSSPRFEQGELDGSIAGVRGRDLGLPGSQLSTQVQVTFLRESPRHGWWLSASNTYAEAQPHGVLTEAREVNSEYRTELKPGWHALALTEYKTDKVRRIDDSLTQTFGLNHRLIDTPRMKLEVMPGVLVHRSTKETRLDGKILPGAGAMQSFSFNTPRRDAFQQRIVAQTFIEYPELYSVESYLGIQAPLTKHIALTVSLESDYDRMLSLQRTDVPAGALSPDSPAASFFATSRWANQLTTGIQVRY
jgi:hypothetical protein